MPTTFLGTVQKRNPLAEALRGAAEAALYYREQEKEKLQREQAMAEAFVDYYMNLPAETREQIKSSPNFDKILPLIESHPTLSSLVVTQEVEDPLTGTTAGKKTLAEPPEKLTYLGQANENTGMYLTEGQRIKLLPTEKLYPETQVELRNIYNPDTGQLETWKVQFYQDRVTGRNVEVDRELVDLKAGYDIIGQGINKEGEYVYNVQYYDGTVGEIPVNSLPPELWLYEQEQRKVAKYVPREVPSGTPGAFKDPELGKYWVIDGLNASGEKVTTLAPGSLTEEMWSMIMNIMGERNIELMRLRSAAAGREGEEKTPKTIQEMRAYITDSYRKWRQDRERDTTPGAVASMFASDSSLFETLEKMTPLKALEETFKTYLSLGVFSPREDPNHDYFNTIVENILNGPLSDEEKKKFLSDMKLELDRAQAGEKDSETKGRYKTLSERFKEAVAVAGVPPYINWSEVFRVLLGSGAVAPEKVFGKKQKEYQTKRFGGEWYAIGNDGGLYALKKKGIATRAESWSVDEDVPVYINTRLGYLKVTKDRSGQLIAEGPAGSKWYIIKQNGKWILGNKVKD